MPWIIAAPRTPERTGSSERYSKLRPHSGERLRLMPGPSTTATPWARASRPSASPTRRASCGSQDDPTAQAAGDADVVGFVGLLAQPVGAVGDHDRRDAEALHRRGVPEVGAQAQRRLL